MPCLTLSVSGVYVLAPPRGTQSIEGCTGQGLRVASSSAVELVDCRILRCDADMSGGGLGASRGAHVKMTRGTISGCSAKVGGGTHVKGAGSLVALVHVLVTTCRATHDEDNEGGGGVFVGSGAVLTMSGGSVRDCEAQNTGGGVLVQSGAILSMSGCSIRDCFAAQNFGGLFVQDSASQVRLSEMTLQGCTAGSDAGCIGIEDANVSLIDVSLEECGDALCKRYALVSWGTLTLLRAERVRIGRPNPKYATDPFCTPTVATVGGSSTWTDSAIFDGPGIGLNLGKGTHTIVRTSIVRSNPATTFHLPGVQIGAGSTLTMTDSYIAGGGYCLRSWGALVVRNTTIHNCSEIDRGSMALQDGPRTRPYIELSSAKAATRFQAELLTLELSCDQFPNIRPLIKIEEEDSAFTAPLNVRGLRIVAPAACALSSFSVFSDRVRPVACSDDGYAPCHATATCTEVPPLPSVPTLRKTVDCSCEGEGGANPMATSPALAPYGFDPSTVGLPDPPIDYCVRPRPLKPQTQDHLVRPASRSHASPAPAATHRSRRVLH